MATVRYVLDCLDSEALRRLLDLRGLERTRSLADMRSRIARSYRGDMAAFLDDLLRKELVALFDTHTFEMQEGWVSLANPARFDNAELHRMARSLFEKEKTPREFEVDPVDSDADTAWIQPGTSCEVLDEGEWTPAWILGRRPRSGRVIVYIPDPESDGEEGWERDVEEHELRPAQSEVGSEGGDETGADDAELVDPEGPFADVTHEWGRPWKIARVLEKAGLEVPERLRTTRFHELLDVLHQTGLEARLADEEESLTADDETPGIHAKLRLRRVGGRVDAPASTPPPIQVVPGGPKPEASRRLQPWLMALARLKLLTAIPSIDRERQPGWPHEFVAAAVEGLGLPEEKVRLLGPVSAQYLRGEHDPFEVLGQLLDGGLSADEWARLFAHFSRLNPGRSEVELLRAHVATKLGNIAVSPQSAGPQPPAPPPVAGPVQTAPMPVRQSAGGSKLYLASDALAALVGTEPISQQDVTVRVWEHIKQNDLQDPTDRRIINADALLAPVFDFQASVTMFEMPGMLHRHLRVAPRAGTPVSTPFVPSRPPATAPRGEPPREEKPKAANDRGMGALDDIFD